jgi:hypothetical protein
MLEASDSDPDHRSQVIDSLPCDFRIHSREPAGPSITIQSHAMDGRYDSDQEIDTSSNPSLHADFSSMTKEW